MGRVSKRTNQRRRTCHTRHRRELSHFGAELQQKAEAREERDGAKEGASVEERRRECPEGPRAGVLEGGRAMREEEPAREKEEGGEGLADDEGVVGGDKRLHGSLQGNAHYNGSTEAQTRPASRCACRATPVRRRWGAIWQSFRRT